MTDLPAAVAIVLPQALADHAGGQRRLALELSDSGTLRDVLDALDGVAPGVGRRVRDETGALRRYVNVYVGDDECRGLEGLETPVPTGAVIHIIPSVAGG